MLNIRETLEKGLNKPLYKLVGGMMNQSYVIEIEGKKYVWYIPTEQANEMVDRKLEKENQEIVYSLGITSKNLAFYDDGMKINEFIPGESLNKVESYDIKKIAVMLKKLHNSPVLCRKNYEPFVKILGYEQEIESMGITVDPLYLNLRNMVFAKRDFLESQKLALCHNDFQKSNIIQTPEDEYYMIDFEFMMNNDPYFDIAGFGNNDVNEGFALLKEYTNNSYTKDELTRFCYWRILLSMQWYLVALIKDKRGEGKTHGFNFYDVAMFFLGLANDAKNLYEKEINK